MSLNRIQRRALGLFISFLVISVFAAAQEAAVAQAPAEGAVAAPAQPGAPVAVGPDGKPVRPGAPGKPVPGQPGQPGQPDQPGAKPEKKEEPGPKAVTRPEKPSLPPDPRELKVEPNPNGKIKFSFNGQPWADVLEWLARISGMSLDWQELPGDYLNLVTQREYSVPEARDLINRHLLARGYTLLEQGEVLTVANIQKLNPGMVPRVEPDQLSKHMPHEYVKVSFPLDWLLSEKAVTELKPMLSPNAKITPLSTLNRIEAVDAVVNLREVYSVLQREQSHDDEQQLVREFVLKHTRAADVIPQLQGLLGMEVKRASARPGAQDQMDMMQQQQMMMMQMQRQGGQPVAQQPKKGEDIHLVETKRNTILANAPPDKMAVISQGILAIDVPSDQTHSLLSNINRMQVYRLHSIDPDVLVRTLMEIGGMDPVSRLEVDTKNKAIIAYASLADHLTIRQVIERLDGSTRNFEVIPLRRLEADYVAGTIEFMMTGPKEQKSQPRYYDYYYSSSRRSETTESTDKFRVDADVENNRLLLWANSLEIEEVTNLLAKLGEIPAENGRGERVRVLDTIAPEELERLMERLKQAWPSLAPNQLQLPALPEKVQSPTDSSPAEKQPAEKQPTEKQPTESRFRPKEARMPSAATDLIALLDDSAEIRQQPLVIERQIGAEPPASERPADAPPNDVPRSQKPKNPSPARSVPGDAPANRSAVPPPVGVSLTPDGRLLITSDDTKALDILEELIGQIAPPRRDYRIFKLKHADSFFVAFNLKDFFDTETKDKSNNNRFPYYYYDYPEPASKDDSSYRLSKRRKLKFIDDMDTNSILVQGADPGQMKTIEDLIKVYDQPQQADSSAARMTTAFLIRYSKAQVIADTIKDVYRDLLSSNDKALQSNNNQNPEQRNRGTPGATYIINEGGDSNNEKERTRVTFKGKLSIGVDEVTNTILVSADGENLMKIVTEMVKSLDEAAKPLSTVSVLRLSGNTKSSSVRDALNHLLVEPKPTAKNAQGPQSPQGRPGTQQAGENNPNGQAPM